MNRQTKIKLYSMLAATIVGTSSFSGCAKSDTKKIEEEILIASENNNYDKFAKFRIVNNEAVMCYRGENIVMAINKETNEISYYISSEKTLRHEIYKLDNGEFVFLSTMGFYDYGKENYENLFNNSDIVNFFEIGDYIEGETCKEWYTQEEIKELEPQILEAVLKIREAKKTLIKTK